MSFGTLYVLKVLLIKEYEICTASVPVPLFLVVLYHIRIFLHHINFLEPNPTFTEKIFSSPIFIL